MLKRSTFLTTLAAVSATPALGQTPYEVQYANLGPNAIEWPMNLNTWEQFACRVAGRNLTPAEWHEVLPNRAYRPTCPAGTR